MDSGMNGRHSGFGRRHAGDRCSGDGCNTGWNEYHRTQQGPHGPYAPHGEYRRTLYRARDGRFMGVCKGLARYFDVRLKYVRLAFILAAVFTGFWPVLGIYVLLGLIIKPEPVIMPQDRDETTFYSEYVVSRSEAVSRLKEKFGRMEQRIRRMEDVVTSRDFDWERRFRNETSGSADR